LFFLLSLCRRARTPKAGSGRWDGPIWDAIDAEASRRSNAPLRQRPAVSKTQPLTLPRSAARQPASLPAAGHQTACQNIGDDGWGAEGAEEEVANWAASLASEQRRHLFDP